jgi:hypothetical protein
MSLTPIQRAESRLSEAVLTLYAAFHTNDFPEHYIRSHVPTIMRERLHELRTLDDPSYRFARARPVAPSSTDTIDPGTALALESESFNRLVALADSKVAEAVDALWEDGPAVVEGYIERSAQDHMAACLRWTRAQEEPLKRAALLEEVSRLRASVDLGPLSWEQIVSR